jgi:hypothetical protein
VRAEVFVSKADERLWPIVGVAREAGFVWFATTKKEVVKPANVAVAARAGG